MNSDEFHFHMDTPLSKGMRELFVRLKERSGLSKSIQVYVAGGMADSPAMSMQSSAAVFLFPMICS